MKKQLILTILCFVLICVGGFTVNAATYTVDRADDVFASNCNIAANDCSLRGAIARANTGIDTVNFDASLTHATITLNSPINIFNGITISGLGADKLTISGGGLRQIFNISVSTGQTTHLSGLTFTDGNSGNSFGGAINLSVSGSGSAIFENLVFQNNASMFGGGAVMVSNSSGSTTFNNIVFQNNSASSSNSNGGALNVSGSGETLVLNSTFTNNSAYQGSGIYQSGGTLRVYNSTFSGNTATNTFNNGGAIYSSSNPLTVRNSTIVNNTGGGIYKGSGAMTLGNTILAGNTNFDFSGFPSPFVRGGNLIGNNILSQSSFPAGTPNANGDYVGTSASPIDPQILPLANNGGFTPTHAIADTSLAINRGNNCVLTIAGCGTNDPPTGLSNDQRGAGFPRQIGTNVDIGALEVQTVFRTVDRIDDPNPAATACTSAANDCSLRGAISGALAGEKINFAVPANSTIDLSNGEISIGVSLSLIGPGASLLTVRGNQQTNQRRVFITAAGANATISISGLRIADSIHNTSPLNGGAIFNNAGNTLSLSQMTFDNNRATNTGGAIYNSGTLTISDSTFTNGNANNGAAIHNQNGVLTVNNSSFTNNTSNFQGVISTEAGTITINDSTITNNSAIGLQFFGGTHNVYRSAINNNYNPGSNFGGGIYINNGAGNNGAINLFDTTVSNNSGGGGIRSEFATVKIYRSTVSGNNSTLSLYGGGLLCQGGRCELENTTVSGNTDSGNGGGNAGGGIYFGSSSVNVINHSTIVGNTATDGGGIYVSGSTVNIRNSVVSGNSDTGADSPDISGVIESQGYNLFGNTTGMTIQGDTTGNILNQDALLAPLANNGGLTQTHLPQSESPVLNAGDLNNILAVDQRGTTRPLEGFVEIGAVEHYSLTFSPPTVAPGLINTPYNQTLTVTGGTAPIVFSIDGGALPTGITLSPEGLISGTPLQSGIFNFTVRATTAANGVFGLKSYTLVIYEFTFSPPTLPNAYQGFAYSQQITVTGGTAPYNFALDSGALPTGITLSASGLISGTTTELGTFNFAVRATDANNFSVVKNYTLDVGNFTFSPPTLPNAFQNNVYSQQITITGGTAPYNYIVSSGALPNGVTLSTEGLLAGTTTQLGTFNFSIRATDANNIFFIKDYVLEVGSFTFAPPNLPAISRNVGYSQQITVTGGTAPYNFSLDSGTLPMGITLSSSGLILGTTTQLGTFNFAVRATDANNITFVKNYALNVGYYVVNTNALGAGSLPQIVADIPVGGTVLFDPVLFGSPQTIYLSGTPISINKNLTINGTGANLLTISGNGESRIFNIANSITATINGMKITQGNALGSNGGGILNNGTLNLNYSTISDCVADSGGAILNTETGTLNIVGSTLSNNRAQTSEGGAISNVRSVNITNSTISGNFAPQSKGGGIYNVALSSFSVNLTNVTIANNSAKFGGGVFNEFASGSFVSARNSIFTDNTFTTRGPDFDGALCSRGNNLISNTDWTGINCTTTGNILNVSAALAPLGDYGDMTQTHALLSNSPALNAGSDCVLTTNGCADNNAAIIFDQRNSQRKIGASVDLGAFERNITFDQSSLPNGSVNLLYSQQLSATRLTNFTENLAPTAFEIVPVAGQSLPNGLTLSASGLISGTPTNTGNFIFTVKATDTDGIAGVEQFAIQVFAPTAANVSISGRITASDGRGIRNAVVTLTDSDGNSRRIISTSFGYYHFGEVPIGETYIISINSKRFTFNPASRILTVNDEIADFDFIAEN